MDQSSVMVFSAYAIAIVLAYAVISRGLFRLTDGLRQSMVPLAEVILSTASLDDDIKENVEARLDDVHSRLAAWRVALSAVLATILMPFLSAPSKIEQIADKRVREALVRYRSNWAIATIGNEPVAALVFLMCALVTMAFSASADLIASLFRGPKDGHNGKHARV